MAVPASEDVLIHFISQLTKEGLKHSTMKVYLSAIRFLHIAEGKEDPFKAPLNRLHYTLKGVKREEARRGSDGRVRLPITPNILRQIKATWESGNSQDPDIVMLWAASCLEFFGFLQAGEMTVPNDSGYDPEVHLNRSDIAVDDQRSPTVLRVMIKKSKTDPFRRGIDLFLGKTFTNLCPVSAMLNYLIVRGTAEGPLFKFKDESPPDKTVTGGCHPRGITEGRFGSVQVLRTQFPYRSSNGSSSKGDGGCSH